MDQPKAESQLTRTSVLKDGIEPNTITYSSLVSLCCTSVFPGPCRNDSVFGRTRTAAGKDIAGKATSMVLSKSLSRWLPMEFCPTRSCSSAESSNCGTLAFRGVPTFHFKGTWLAWLDEVQHSARRLGAGMPLQPVRPATWMLVAADGS